jgi:ubiquinone/menaquinone biosynthesis C-methylase UbiE
LIVLLVGAGSGLGDIAGKKILDLACGTGEISRMLLDLGAKVTGIDFAEPMLARAKAKLRGRDWTGMLGDAERLDVLQPASFDGAITRHLAWTLTDPLAAYAAIYRVLKPGARLLIIDGDWVSETPRARLLRGLAKLIDGKDGQAGADMERHKRILSQVPYANGLTPERLREDLERAGFSDATRHSTLAVYLWGMRGAGLGDRLRLLAPKRFALSAKRPG